MSSLNAAEAFWVSNPFRKTEKGGQGGERVFPTWKVGVDPNGKRHQNFLHFLQGASKISPRNPPSNL